MGLQKTISLLILILLGVLLKNKISTKDQVSGLKTIILSIALPATIFIALLKIEITSSLIFLPVLALVANFLMFGGAKLFTLINHPNGKPEKQRTLLMLMPSLAPGLSCFPFIIEYLGEESLALAALADIGNKIFGLIILYLIAMTWYYKISESGTVNDKSNKYKSLFKALIKEPINIVIVVAISLLCFGINFTSLPSFGQDAIGRLSAMMTPLVLIFIGVVVKVGKKDVVAIIQLLFWRSGFAFALSGFLIFMLPKELSIMTLLLIVVFPQSSCSFWPFAHMSAVNKLNNGKSPKIFDLELAVNILAFSLPFSTVIIMTICSAGAFFTEPITLGVFGLSFIILSISLKYLNVLSGSIQGKDEKLLPQEV